MKKIILEKYKLINLGLFLVLIVILVYMKTNYENWFKGSEALDFYKYYYAIYSPIFTGGKWFSGILAGLLLFPSQIFRKWLFYIAPVFLILTYILVQNISVYSTNLLNPTRAQMAENCMIVLAVITAIFAIVHIARGWKNKK